MRKVHAHSISGPANGRNMRFSPKHVPYAYLPKRYFPPAGNLKSPHIASVASHYHTICEHRGGASEVALAPPIELRRGPGAQPPENFGQFYFLEHVFTIEFTYFLAIYDCYKMTIFGYLFRFILLFSCIVWYENS